jgi:hypothetical protein
MVAGSESHIKLFGRHAGFIVMLVVMVHKVTTGPYSFNGNGKGKFILVLNYDSYH